MEQVTTTIARRTVARVIVAALMLALATVLVVSPTSPVLAQEEAPQEVQEAQEEAQPPTSDQATLSFELTVKGEVPEGTRFFGSAVGEGGPGVPLTDPDGGGTFTGSVTVPRFPPGPRPLPPGTEPISLSVQIVQENGGNIEVIRDFGVVPLDGDRTFSARVNFKRDRGGTETPEDTVPDTPDGGSEDGSGASGGSGSGGSGDASDLTAPENGVDLNEDGSADAADGEVASATSDAAMEVHRASGGNALPATGGVGMLPIMGSVGALLVGGLLIRRLAR